ncbi:hypothetical protein K6U06_15060 [Acidiferrimicrobium sp. IK]|uniref:hypothetical protein n=1 Tax=Acidiferrimicrobium sp. IK TaxID=2871700 RepID=UPI0021CB3A78|nr:hypothetical protein [Acidiferrimicrobium sp. IK]MCU4185686.1 hypothetical protein [Acidiferrimicrobium sp. IK]
MSGPADDTSLPAEREDHTCGPGPAAEAGARPDHTDHTDDVGDAAPARWWERLESTDRPQAVLTLLVVAACVVFTFVQLKPSKLFANTTPAGGDMGAHVWLPAYVKAHLLPHFRLTGWTQDWYDGFPALTYYFPLPIVAIAVVSYVIPYNIAFKLVSVLGLLAMPIAAWALGRLARMPFPAPACLATGALVFLFNRDFTIYGGNIASTMAGEFSFAISLALALVFLGLVARGLDTGRSRGLAAVVLACCAMSHVLPLFFAVGGAILMYLLRPQRRRWRWLLPVLVTGGLLAAWWALPFEYRLPYATNMGYQKLTTYVALLFPHGDTWLFVVAGVGALASLVRRRPIGTWLVAMTVAAAVVFRFAPQARLWNARVLPFWFLCLYLLASLAVAELGIFVAEGVTRRPDLRLSLIPVPVVSLLAALIWVGYPLHILPFGHMVANKKSGATEYSWLGIHSTAAGSYVPDWVDWNYSGYQSPGKARRAEYFALVAEMKKLGQDPADGCGQAMWEYEPELDQMGTPDALMLLPYWTNGCVGSMEGLYYESSATTPYHFLNVSELSDKPSDPMVGLQYATAPDVTLGIQHLQMLGVKYFMALTPDVQSQASADTALEQVGSVGPFPVSYTSGSQTTVTQRTWKIYKLIDSAKVTPLLNQPVVMNHVGSNEAAWLKASQAWYLSPSRWSVFETSSGPSSWARVSPSAATVPEKPLPPVQVSSIKQTESSVSFDVSQTGVPVLVKVSYFPNWHASGAGTVYRATPNLMIVVPTSHHVTLSYGYTPVDWAGFLLSLLGLVGVAGLAVAGRVRYPAYFRPAGEPLTVGGDGEWPWADPSTDEAAPLLDAEVLGDGDTATRHETDLPD